MGSIILFDSLIYGTDEYVPGAQHSIDKKFKVFRGEIVGIGIIVDSNCKFASTPRHYVVAVGDDKIVSEGEDGSSILYVIKVSYCVFRPSLP